MPMKIGAIVTGNGRIKTEIVIMVWADNYKNIISQN
jgi:hypothetical protein